MIQMLNQNLKLNYVIITYGFSFNSITFTLTKICANHVLIQLEFQWRDFGNDVVAAPICEAAAAVAVRVGACRGWLPGLLRRLHSSSGIGRQAGQSIPQRDTSAGQFRELANLASSLWQYSSGDHRQRRAAVVVRVGSFLDSRRRRIASFRDLPFQI